jgi:hypothetical protein
MIRAYRSFPPCELQAENLVIRCWCSTPNPGCGWLWYRARLLSVWLYRVLSSILRAIIVSKPETLYLIGAVNTVTPRL